MAESRRSSILKPPKQRAPLQEVSSLNIHNQTDFTTTTTFTQHMMRRVSFAGTSTVKEFDTQAESVLVCHTPAYEESFTTSDSSVPSDSSRFSSRSTISIEDHSAVPPSCDVASQQNLDPENLILKEFGVEPICERTKKPSYQNLDPENVILEEFGGEPTCERTKKSSHQNLDPEDLILKEFGVEPTSQRAKSPSRRPRFSIAGPSDEETSPAPVEKPLPAISSASFYGKSTSKPRSSTISSPRSLRLSAIDPFTLRPKAANSPKSQSKRKSQVPPPPSPRTKTPSAKSLFNSNESPGREMDLTRTLSGNIFLNTPSPSIAGSASTPGSAPLRTGNRTVNGNAESTQVCTPSWKNKTIYDSGMDITRTVPSRILTSDKTNVQFSSDGQLHCSIRNSTTMEFTTPMSSVAIRNEQYLVIDKNKSVACASQPYSQDSTPGVYGTATSLPGDVAPGLRSSDHSQRADFRMLNKLSDAMYNPVDMGTTEVASRTLNKTVSDPEGMEFTEVIHSVPVTENARIPQAMNSTVCEQEGMEFTRIIPSMPVMSKEFESSPRPFSMKNLNETLNDSVGMDFTEAMPSVPLLHEDWFSGDHGTRTYNKTLNDSVGMDFTEAVRAVPIQQDFARSFPSEPANKTMSESTGMEFTKVIPSVLIPQENLVVSETSSKPVLDTQTRDSTDTELTQTSKTCHYWKTGFSTNGTNAPLNDSACLELTNVIHTPIFSNSSETSKLVSEVTELPNSVITTQRTELSMNGTKLQDADSFPSVPHIVPLVTEPETDMSDTSARTSATLGNLTPKKQLCRKRSFEEVDKHDQDEIVSPKSRLLASPVLPAPSEIVVPSSRSPSPVEHDSSTRFPGLCQSFSGGPKITESPNARETRKPPEESHLEGTGHPTSAQVVPENGVSSKMEIVSSLPDQSLSGVSNTPESLNVRETSKPPEESHLEGAGHATLAQFVPENGVSSKMEIVSSLPDQSLSGVSNTPESLNVLETNKPSELSQLEGVGHSSTNIVPVSGEPCNMEEVSRSLPGLCYSFSRGLKTTESLNVSETTKPPEESHLVGVGYPTSAQIAPESGKSPTLEIVSTNLHATWQSSSGGKAAESVNLTEVNKSGESCDMEIASEAVESDKEINVYSVTNAEVSTNRSPPCGRLSLITPKDPVSPTDFPVQLRETSDETELTNTPVSTASEDVMRYFHTPSSISISDISYKTKSASPEQYRLENNFLHKSLLDVSYPSIVDISDVCSDRDLSSNTRLNAIVLEAESNVCDFHKEEEELGNCVVNEESNMSIREEPEERGVVGEEERRGSYGIQVRGVELERMGDESHRNLSSQSVIPNESPRFVERYSVLSKSSVADLGTSRLEFGVCRPLEDIIKTHRSEYRKRARCSWTSRNLKDNEWCFDFLDSSVELRIKLEVSSRTGLISGSGGRFISLIEDDLHGVWYIGGRLLYQKLSTEWWTSRIQETTDVLTIVDEANVVANNVALFMSHLAHLLWEKNMEITHDWIRFDVTSERTTYRWFKVKVDCRDIVNIKPHHVTIENIIGETRETDIQNLVTCVKKNALFLRNYIGVVEEYVQTIERVR